MIVIGIIGGGVILMWGVMKLLDIKPPPPSNVKCPKCGGSDYFMSTRNIVRWAWLGGKMKNIPVCKVCHEIMGY